MQERVFKLRLPMQHCPYITAPLRQGWTIPFYKVKATMFLLLQNSSITKPGFVILNVVKNLIIRGFRDPSSLRSVGMTSSRTCHSERM